MNPTLVAFALALVTAGQAAPEQGLSTRFSASVERRLNERHGNQFKLMKAKPGYGRVSQVWVPNELKVEDGLSEEERQLTLDYWEFPTAELTIEAWAHATDTSIGPGESVDGPWDEGRAWWNYNGRGFSRIKFRIGNTITNVGGPKAVVRVFSEDVAYSVVEEAKAKERKRTR